MQNLPNLLTIFRIAMIPALYLAFQLDGHFGDWLCIAIYTLACLSDFFDGWVARRYDVQSGFGRMLDPIADKLTIATCLILLAHAQIVTDLHLAAAVIIMCREVLVSGLREYLIELRISLPVSTLAKYKTTIQMVAIGFLLSDEGGKAVWADAHSFGLVLLWLAAGLTLITGYDYLRQGLKHAKWSD